MVKKYKVFLVLFLFICHSFLSFSQTKVSRYYANKENNYGIVYSLPKSLIQISLSVKETKYIPGQLAKYSKIYTDKYAEDKEYTNYEIVSANVKSVGVIDTTKRFLIVFDDNTVAPFVSLTNNGIISSINANDNLKEEELPPLYTQWTTVDKQIPSLPETYFTATDKIKKAEIASKYLNFIKQSTVDLLTGDMENMPKDGAGIKLIMDRLNTETKRTERLFWGDTISRMQNVRIYLEPTTDDINNKMVLRFSKYFGIVNEIDLSGDPIIFDLKITNKYPIMDNKEKKRFLKKLDGIVYNMPATANVTLRSNNKILYEGDIPITQAGTMQTLRNEMFNTKNNKNIQVLFDVNSGTIKNIKE